MREVEQPTAGGLEAVVFRVERLQRKYVCLDGPPHLRTRTGLAVALDERLDRRTHPLIFGLRESVPRVARERGHTEIGERAAVGRGAVEPRPVAWL